MIFGLSKKDCNSHAYYEGCTKCSEYCFMNVLQGTKNVMRCLMDVIKDTWMNECPLIRSLTTPNTEATVSSQRPLDSEKI